MENQRTSHDFPNQSELRDREAIVQRLTKRLLRFALKKTGTKMIIVLGHLRSGKSSLFESLTNSTGHSRDGIDPVTREYQIGRARINGSIYLFVDTPGLNDPFISNASILSEIARLLYVTKDSVVYAGVLYVHPVSAQFSDETRRGLQFLEAFCGLDYAPSITFVTTMWDLQSPKGVKVCDSVVEQLVTKKWSCFMDRGAKIYHHGRRYENGNLTMDVLDLEDDEIVRRRTVREIIASIYPANMEYPTPLIIQELRANTPLENTAVGKFLGMTSLELVPVIPHESSNPQPDGFDWFGSLVNLLKIPVQIVGSYAMALWNFLDKLQSRIASVMGPSNMTISLHHLSSNKIEALISLPGGLRFIVGYGPSGPYWRPWASQDEYEAGFQVSDDDSESSFDGDPIEFNGRYEDPQNVAFGEMFDSVLFSTMSDDTAQESEPTISKSTWSFWDNCAVM